MTKANISLIDRNHVFIIEDAELKRSGQITAEYDFSYIKRHTANEQSAPGASTDGGEIFRISEFLFFFPSSLVGKFE